MTSIQEQIKALQRRQAKILRYMEANEAIGSLPKIPEHDGLAEEVAEEIQNLIQGRVTALEAGQTTEVKSAGHFSENEIATLKALAERAAAKANQSAPAPASESPPAENPKPRKIEIDRNDKMRFAMANRHLDNQRVIIHTKDGDVLGRVCGLDAPDVIVKTDTGYTAAVPLEQIELTPN